MRHGRDGFYLQFAALQHLFFIRRPPPAVGQILRYDRAHLADVHHHRRDVLYAIFLRRFLDVANDIEDDSKFVH